MERGTVVVVEDDPDISVVVSGILREAGFGIHAFDHGQAGVDAVNKHSPEVVVVDLGLPDIDGLEVCRSIRANPATHAIRVVQTSAAFITDQDVVNGFESGADGYLTVPYEPNSLIAMLRSLLD